jgi:hypothetical protein
MSYFSRSETMTRPQASEYAQYYEPYIALVPEADALAAMRAQLERELPFLSTIPEAKAGIVHPPYAWTIRQVVSHLTDGERIFCYRALRIARGDAIPLPGYDENAYAKTAGTERLTLKSLTEELESVRRATITLFQNLPPEAWARAGIANDKSVTVRALAFIIAGHARHHLAIIRKRLGMPAPTMRAAAGQAPAVAIVP